jgi:anti-sigma factor RsiW
MTRGLPDDHREFDELAVGWALHALEPEDETLFAAHLPGCDRCSATVAETTDVMAAMATDLPAAEPSEALRTRLAAAVEQTAQVHAAAPEPIVPRDASGATTRQHVVALPRWRRALPVALAAAALAAIVGLGLWTVVLSSDREELESTVARQSSVMADLLTPGRATVAPLSDDGRPMATVVARDGELTVVTQGLPANEADETTYVVWGLEGTEATALGTFDVNGSQMELQTVGSGLTGLDDYGAFGISLEPGQEAPPAPTDVVATGQVTS